MAEAEEDCCKCKRFGLTPIELNVIRLLAWGYKSTEVASFLSLSLEEVERNRSSAYHALHVEDLQRAVVMLRYRHGMDVLAEPPAHGEESRQIRRVILRGTHPRAGQCAEFIAMVQTDNGQMPRVRLDNGEEWFVFSVDQIS